MTTGEEERDAIKALPYELASREVLSLDPEDMARRAGAEFVPAPGRQEPGRIKVPFLGKVHSVILDPDGVQVVDEEGDPAPKWAEIVILHYLAMARDVPPSGVTVTFREFKDGHLYHPNFEGRVLRRTEGVFGTRADQLVKAAEPLSGRPADHGDAAVTLEVFPRLAVIFVVWEADDEFPARASVLFDETAEQHLPAEDIVVLCQQIAGMLARNLSGGNG